MKYLYLFILCIPAWLKAEGVETIYFKAADGVEVAADLYMPHPKSAGFIVLFHQANYSRGEYKEIAPKLNELGYNCMAVDLRSGGTINNVNNITKQHAQQSLKGTQYIDAVPDMKAAIQYAKDHFALGKLIVWGSSYSAGLSIRLAGEKSIPMDAVMAFSPGEYYASQGKPRDFVTAAATNIQLPVFITSARNEKNAWWGIYVAIPSEKKTYYLPDTAGNHGSKALWDKFTDAQGYWEAVEKFLSGI